MKLSGPVPAAWRVIRGTGARRALAASLAGAMGIAVWCGCTVTKENYATLSFFFDGVPDPSAKGGGPEGDALIAERVVVHKPFAEEKCEACHKTQYRPSRNDARACLECHDKLMDEHAWTHGAVAGGACLWCHSPHESVRKWLLRGPDRKLCAQCHAPAMLNDSTVPAHADEKLSCLSCHFGHGGDSATMLRPGATATTPAPESALKEEFKNQPVFNPERGDPQTTTPPEPGPQPAPDQAPGDEVAGPPETPAPK